MSAEKNDSAKVLERLIRLCDDLAWGRPADENALFELTKTGASTPELERLAEAFGMMTVKVEAREFQRAGLIEELEQRNRELEEARARLQDATCIWWRRCGANTTCAASSAIAKR